jgi:hypothetical protein
MLAGSAVAAFKRVATCRAGKADLPLPADGNGRMTFLTSKKDLSV